MTKFVKYMYSQCYTAKKENERIMKCNIGKDGSYTPLFKSSARSRV